VSISASARCLPGVAGHVYNQKVFDALTRCDTLSAVRRTTETAVIHSTQLRSRPQCQHLIRSRSSRQREPRAVGAQWRHAGPSRDTVEIRLPQVSRCRARVILFAVNLVWEEALNHADKARQYLHGRRAAPHLSEP